MAVDFGADTLPCRELGCLNHDRCQAPQPKVAACALCGQELLALNGRLPEGWAWDGACHADSYWAWCPEGDAHCERTGEIPATCRFRDAAHS